MTSTVTGPDPSIWREHGEPLAVGAPDGPLAGQRIALKDLYALVGSRVGAGNPTWLAGAPLETESATVVRTLLEAGAVVQGLAQTDELAWSLAGTNAHYGTPLNRAATGRIPGGSSSGSATAVALGQADIGLGTDTGGSIRVPAAYQGLYGIRTTHDLLPRDGVLPLAASFDTVGWLTRDAATLAAVGDVLLPPAEAGGPPELVVVDQLVALADDEVADAVGTFATAHGAVEEAWALEDLPRTQDAFSTLQGWEAWRRHGAWVSAHPDALGPDVAARFEQASRITAADAETATTRIAAIRHRLRSLLGDRVLVLPSAPTVAPALGDDLAQTLQQVRDATLRLTCLAGVAGLPAVSVPLTTAAGLPCGVCLIAAPGRDRDLLALAQRALPA